MGDQAIIQLTIDIKTVLAVSGGLFAIISFLIVLLGKLVINGINNTITSCHGTLESTAAHNQKMNDVLHDNHERRIVHLESATFKASNNGN
jgi:hypothetical protein